MDKNGLSSIVATVLLVLMVVVVFVSFQSWYSNYNSELLASHSSSSQGSANILEMQDSILYVQNKYDSYNISSVIIDGEECSSVAGNYNESIIQLNLSSCSINGDFGSITINSPQGFTEKTVAFDKVLVPEPKPFISVWNTSISGTSNNDQITLPLTSQGSYDFTVNWGDGSNDTITQWNQSEVIHTYSSSGKYEVEITGDIEGWRFDFSGDRRKILEIKQWGSLKLGNQGNYFYGASNLQITATDILDTSGMTNFTNMFSWTESITTIPNIEQWDTSSITNMSGMFSRATLFNQPLNEWNTNSVKDMGSMFSDATSFNQPLNNWNTSSLITMQNIFNGASSFNGSVNSWDTSSVTYMPNIFRDATSFNQPLNSWDVSNVTYFGYMFNGAESFNQPLNNWDTSSTTFMSSMFGGADSFIQDISSWCVTNIGSKPFSFDENAEFESLTLLQPNWGNCGRVKKFSTLWNTSINGSSNDNQITLPLISEGTYDFTVKWGDGGNDTITQWNESVITHTYSSQGVYEVNITGDIEGWMFNNTGDSNKILEIKQWGPLRLSENQEGAFTGASNLTISATDIFNTTGVTNFTKMFSLASSITSIPTINYWDTSKVKDTSSMFNGVSSFNQSLDNWDVSNVKNMGGMFGSAESFNQNISSWDTSNATNMRYMFASTSNFNQPLNSWDVSNVKNMRGMFYGSAYNQSLNNWDVSNVEDMRAMFYFAIFNQPLDNWNTSSVTNMVQMFYSAQKFNQNISTWCVEQIGSQPVQFDYNAGFEDDYALHPNWGNTC